MDGPQKANSGHPGTAMALAPAAYALWTRVMDYDASDPHWPNRDRFVLSNGHASILLYSMLHLTGFGLTLDDIRQFRQWGSKTPGHPERLHTEGVEVTTGPLGQGFSNAVGMAIAEHNLRARYGSQLFDHNIFCFAGDGCFMEGISHEAAGLAGHLGLGKLVVLYDDNHITIDGPTELAYNDNVGERFEAYGWHVDPVGEIANDVDGLEAAFRRAMTVDDKPSVILLRSHIGYPSPKYTDTAYAHGSPLGDDEVRVTKEILGLPPDETFYVPEDVLAHWREAGARGKPRREAWEKLYAEWPDNKAEIDACLNATGLPGWQDDLPAWNVGDKVATRKASGACFNALYDSVPALIGGGADLTGNTGTELKTASRLDKADWAGRQVHFGVREHGMGGVMNGIAAHSGLIPVGGTFFVFSDYMRGSVRLSALSHLKVVFSWTHDSVGLGEDGPTHQPIEHLAAMRAMPGLRVVRPADANETATAWKQLIEYDGPTALILSRQNLPVLAGTASNDGLLRGAYVLQPGDGTADIVLIGTGSEVSVCVDAAEQLASEHISASVVSMPCWEVFEAQGQAYRDEVLVPGIPRLSVEAASTFGWSRWADDSVGIDRFGASAPGAVALDKLGINPSNVVDHAKALLGRS
ncbi:MAG: transketolase [Actinobacteria bacterium]|nr:transketolase [Actinomycetota bacterium]